VWPPDAVGNQRTFPNTIHFSGTSPTGDDSVDKIERIFDYGGTTGGPIIRNRLWYTVSLRYPTVFATIDDFTRNFR
jgi:hypothetical protein